jgi:hypothetical protein
MSPGVHFAAIARERTIAHVRSTWERLFVVVLVALMLAAGATAAEAKKKRLATAKSADFTAELSGTQFARTDIGGNSECDMPLPSGTSTERIEFQATTFAVEVTRLPGDVVVGKNGNVLVPVNGTVTRSNMGSAACQDNPREPEDCGVMPITAWHLELQWGGKGFNLIAGLPGVDRDVFGNCASRLLLDPYPTLTGAEDTHFVVARASIKDLLNRRKHQILTQASDFQMFSSDNAVGTVTLDYRLTLTRKPSKRPTRKR